MEKFSNDEKKLFLMMLTYYMSKEEEELNELSSPHGNPRFIPEIRNRIRVFESIKKKVEEALF